MIWFYRDFLDGFVYIVFALLSLIFIMAIIGFILERLQFEREEKNRIAVLNAQPGSVLSNPSHDNFSNVNSSSNIVMEGGIVPEKNANAVTNEDIPAVLDLDAVDVGNRK